MLVESSRALGFFPQFSKFLRHRLIGVNKFSSAQLPEIVKQSNEVVEEKSNSPEVVEEKSNSPEVVEEKSNSPDFGKFRFKYPEFLPNPTVRIRNAVREKLERRDMLRRRNNIFIPEFYVGSVLAVTSSSKHAVTKTTKFVGICIMKRDAGLSSTFLLRNIIENQGVEVSYLLYSPLILKIEVLRLEKRLDETLYYLRDAPQEYSTFPFDMLVEYHDANKPVPVNTLKVPLNPRPWLQKYEQLDLKGIILPEISEKLKKKAEKAAKPWEKYDLMDEYRKIVPEEDQKDVFAEICDELKRLEKFHKQHKKGKEFVKPSKQKLF